MAVDKLVDSTQLNADLTSVANAIRAKSGGSNSLAFPSGFITEIASIPTVIDGNNLEYGLTDGTQPLVGVAEIGYAEVE